VNRRLALAGLASALLALVSLSVGGVEAQTGPSCAAAKKKIAGKKDQKLLTCDSAAVVKGVSPDADCR